MILSMHQVSQAGAISLVAANLPFSNLQWTRRMSSCGEFSARLICPLPAAWPGRLLVTLDCRDEVGVVEKVEAAESSSGTEMDVSGRFAESLWDRWRAGADGAAATGADWRQAVTSALLSWHMGDLPPLALGPGAARPTGSSYRLVAGKGDSAMEAVLSCASSNGGRPKVTYDRDADPGHLAVGVAVGLDRTRSQSERPPQVFGLQSTSASKVTYGGDYSCACSEVAAHAERESSGSSARVDRTVAVPGFDASAQWEQRAWEDVGSLVGTDVDPTEANVDAAGLLRAYDHMPALTVDCSTTGAGYMETWDLCDLCEVEVPSLGLVARERVEEVREVWKASGHTVEATLGTRDISRVARALMGRR